MKKPSSTSAATPNRQRLLPRGALVVIAISVSAGLVLLYPKDELLQEAEKHHGADKLTATYLSNLLKTEPDNIKMQLLLAEQKLKLGEFNESERLLNLVIEQGAAEQRNAAWLLKIHLINDKLYKQPQHAQRTAWVQQQREVLTQLVEQNLPNATLADLAKTVVTADAPEVGLRLYQKIYQQNGPQQDTWFANEAKVALGRGYYTLAAELYFMAQNKAQTLEAQRVYFLEGLNVLLAAGYFDALLVAADQHIANLKQDAATLFTLVNMSRAANNLAHAASYMQTLFALSEQTPEIRDEAFFQLAWDIALANKNLPEAYRVAAAAVHAMPGNVIWLEHYARVAEWTAQPVVAIQQWQLLLKQGHAEAAAAIFRLAPGLNDHEALLVAWQNLAKQRELTAEEWQKVYNLYEFLGRPVAAAEFFTDHYALRDDARLLEMAARLRENAGEDETALKLWLFLLKKHGTTRERVMHVAAIYFKSGALLEAADFLYQNRAVASATDFEYWRMLGDLCWQQQKFTEASFAYQQLINDSTISKEEAFRLLNLLRRQHNEQAIVVAEQMWRKFAEPEMLLFALEQYGERQNYPAQHRLIDSVGDKTLKPADMQLRFLLLRAQYYQAIKQTTLAMNDYRRAVALEVNNHEARIALLWMLINQRDKENLHAALKKLPAKAASSSEYWGVLAASYQLLGQHDEAVKYFGKQYKQYSQDYLWLMGYADSLEQAEQAGMAWRMRQRAWKELRRNKEALTKANSPEMLAAARLIIQQAPGDPSLALVRKIARLDVQAIKDGKTDPVLSELLLSWAMSTEQNTAAKSWLWQRYSRELQRPVWAEAAIALADNDLKKLEQLMLEQAEQMPASVKHDAARVAKQFAEAKSISALAFKSAPLNDEWHSRFSEDVLSNSGNVSVALKSNKMGALKRETLQTAVNLPLNDKVQVNAKVALTQQRVIDQTALGVIPAQEKNLELGFKWLNPWGETSAALFKRENFDFGFRVNHAYQIDSRMRVDVAMTWQDMATESAPAWVAAKKNQFDVNWLYNFSKREYVRIQPVWAAYFTQDGSALGNSKTLNWEVGHRLRTEYPDMTFLLLGSHIRTQRDGKPDAATAKLTPAGTLPDASFFLSDSANNYQTCVNVGESARYNYSKAVRPYGSVCASNNSVSGTGYSVLLGGSTSIANGDAVSFELSKAKASNRFSGSLSEIMFRYHYLLNR